MANTSEDALSTTLSAGSWIDVNSAGHENNAATTSWIYLEDSQNSLESVTSPNQELQRSTTAWLERPTTRTEVALEYVLEHEEVALAEEGATARGVSAILSVVAPSVLKKRAPVALIAVIDRSGSMAGTKLGMTLKTLRFVLSQLRDVDSFGLVSYSSDVRVDIELGLCTPESKLRMEYAIQSIRHDGQTNLSGGLLKAIDLHREAQRTAEGLASSHECVRSVFLLTDGLANVGITGRDAIASAAQASLAEMHPHHAASIHCFGFGSDHDASMLRSVAEKGGGSYFYIKNEDMIATEFAGALGGLLSIAMQSATLRIASPKVTIKTGLPVRCDSDGVHTVELGDLLAEERRDILIDFNPLSVEGAVHEVGSEVFLCEATVRGFSLDESTWCQQGPLTMMARVAAADSPPSDPDLRVAIQRNRFTATSAMEAALKAAGRGHLRSARNFCTAALRSIKDSVPFLNEDALTLKLVADLRECRENMCDSRAYEEHGSKTLTTCTMSHTWQSHGSYQNTEQTQCLENSISFMMR